MFLIVFLSEKHFGFECAFLCVYERAQKYDWKLEIARKVEHLLEGNLFNPANSLFLWIPT